MTRPHRPSRARPITRRTLFRGGIAIGTIFVAGGCAAEPGQTTRPDTAAPEVPDADSTGSIRVMVWSGLVEPLVTEHAVKPFSAKYPDVTVELEVGTNAELYPKLLATRGSGQYVGGMMNDLYTAIGVNDDMWTELDLDLIPNAASVPESLNPQSGYGITLMLTGLGIAYNPDAVTAPPTSWEDLYDPAYRGRVVMSDGYFGAYQMAALLDGKDIDDVEAGIEVWEGHKDNIGNFTNAVGQQLELISSGSMALGPVFGAWTEQAVSQGKNVAFAVPDEGQIMWSGALQVMAEADAAEAGLAQAFYDEFYSNEFQTAFMTEGFFIPARGDVEVPDELRAASPAVITAEEAVEALLATDVQVTADNQKDYTTAIQRRLKG